MLFPLLQHLFSAHYSFNLVMSAFEFLGTVNFWSTKTIPALFSRDIIDFETKYFLEFGQEKKADMYLVCHLETIYYLFSNKSKWNHYKPYCVSCQNIPSVSPSLYICICIHTDIYIHIYMVCIKNIIFNKSMFLEERNRLKMQPLRF